MGIININGVKMHNSTATVAEMIENFAFDEEYLPGKDFISSLEYQENFYEYVEKNAKCCGYKGKSEKDLVDFIHEKCIESNIFFSEKISENKRTLRNWLIKKHPPMGDGGRESVYKLCFVLNMDIDATKEFFMKGFLERPFDYKDEHEATYFFCK